MKSILMSIKPKWTAKILNGEKTIEIRKRFPKDYRGWVYIYCTKKEDYLFDFRDDEESPDKFGSGKASKWFINNNPPLNGKVVARFYCDNIYEIENRYCKGMLIDSCLSNSELNDYLGNNNGYAIHISQLEIFDKPKELSEFFHNFKHKYCERKFSVNGIVYNIQYDALSQPTKSGYELVYRLTKAPQSWQFIEVKE